MAAFRYRAMDGAGKTQSGMLEAASAATARQSLRQRGLLPMEVVASAPAQPRTRPAGADAPQPRRLPGMRRASGLSRAALTLTTRQMATLLRSGLRIEEALQTIASGQSPKVAGILLTQRAAVLEGRSYGAALGEFPQVYSDFYRATIRAGEQAGRLAEVMAHLAGFVETQFRNRQTVQLALLYPALLGLVSLSIITLLMVYVVPDIVKVFRDRGADLPLLTRALIGASALIRTAGPAAAVGLCLAGVGLSRWLRPVQNRLRLHRWLATGPMTRKLVQRMNAAQVASTLSTLLLSRVPLVEALDAAAGVTPNLHVRAQLADAAAKVRQGVSLHRALDEARAFPAMMVAMVASGEATGDLGAALGHAATEQQRDLDAWVRAMVALVEPAILLVMGGLVMAMVLAILLPIVSLNGLVDG